MPQLTRQRKLAIWKAAWPIATGWLLAWAAIIAGRYDDTLLGILLRHPRTSAGRTGIFVVHDDADRLGAILRGHGVTLPAQVIFNRRPRGFGIIATSALLFDTTLEYCDIDNKMWLLSDPEASRLAGVRASLTPNMNASMAAAYAGRSTGGLHFQAVNCSLDIGFVVLMGVGARRLLVIRRLTRLSHTMCGECGYDISAVNGERCPECGTRLDVE